MLVGKSQTCVRWEDEEGLLEDTAREKQEGGGIQHRVVDNETSAVLKVMHLKLFICGAFCQVSLSKRPNEDAD